MKRTLATAVVTVVMLTACDRGSRPNPKREHTVPTGVVVKMCVERALLLRAKEGVCEVSQPGFAWCWVEPAPRRKELPAIEHHVEPDWCVWREPTGAIVATIPESGAVFP